MENMTVYTSDLMVEYNYIATRKMRNAGLICSIILAVLIVGLIVCSYIFDDYFFTFMIIYVLLAIIFIFAWSVYRSTTKSGLKKNIEKQMQDNAKTVNYYKFEENGFTVKSVTAGTESFTRVEYSFIKKIEKVTNEIIFLYNKQNQVYVVQDKQGIDGLYEYVCEKSRQNH
ncbi:MAG: hypothetical protein J6C23_06595 [Clostridia bacterium]|nr:hypothetical protein [Clostridia bacterium]